MHTSRFYSQLTHSLVVTLRRLGHRNIEVSKITFSGVLQIVIFLFYLIEYSRNCYVFLNINGVFFSTLLLHPNVPFLCTLELLNTMD